MTKTNKRLIIAFICAAVVGWIWIRVHFASKIHEMEDEHTRQMQALRDKWNKEKKDKEAAYRAELEKAWGGGIKAAIKDPDATIAEMLRKAAIASCPHCQRTEVKTDNFNEFDVYIHVASVLDKNTAAKAVKSLLAACGEYVNSVSFVYGNEVVKTIDKRGIDGIKNWESVGLTTVANAMYSP